MLFPGICSFLGFGGSDFTLLLWGGYRLPGQVHHARGSHRARCCIGTSWIRCCVERGACWGCAFQLVRQTRRGPIFPPSALGIAGCLAEDGKCPNLLLGGLPTVAEIEEAESGADRSLDLVAGVSCRQLCPITSGHALHIVRAVGEAAFQGGPANPRG